MSRINLCQVMTSVELCPVSLDDLDPFWRSYECDMCSQFVCGSSEHFPYCVTSCMYWTSEVIQFSLRLCKFCVHCCKQLFFVFFLWHFLHLGLSLFYIQNEDRWLVAPVLVQRARLLKAELGCKWCGGGGGVSPLRRGEDDQENCQQKHTGLLLPPFWSHPFCRSTYRVTSFWTWLHSVELGHFDVLYEMLEVWDASLRAVWNRSLGFG